ncbi:MAG: TetR/AcrR family transcriptional regulator [Burkholderiaceae bacterium]|nr:TetR/AcrR family transcriptional regulator [Burkholderiaceae bacterium]
MPPSTGNRRIAQGLQSRARLVQAARDLFERQGYAGTSTEALLAATGLTRGALYHHFRDKQDLFLAVCDAIHAELSEAIAAVCEGLGDPAEQLIAGSLAWIDAVSAPGPRQVLLIDAPSVLGAEQWAALDDRHGFRQLREGVLALLQPVDTAAGQQAEAAAVALNGAINALAAWGGELPAPQRREALTEVLRRLYGGLLPGPSLL